VETDHPRMNSIVIDTPQPRRFSPLPRLRVMAHDATYLILGLPIGVAAFSLVVTGLALGAGLAITLVGIPIILATLIAARGIAELERRRAAPVLGAPIRGRERRLEGDAWARTRTVATDPATWRDTLWSLLLLPIGTAGFTVAVTVWSTALGLVSSPLYVWALPDDDDNLPFFDDPGLMYSVLRVLTGIALIPLAAWASRAAAAGSARLARMTLG
jgi:hypothetical protein